MKIKNIILLLSILLFISCSEDDSIATPKNLQEYITINENKILDEVIACAASKNETIDVSYIFYYPISGATNIQYFETETSDVNKDDFDLYLPVNLEKEDVFNGYLQRFIRNDATESWCIVTYETNGKVHVSNPIKLKNASKPTAWVNEVTINTATSLMPQFLWEDGSVTENEIYFQVISNSENDLLSGTYTYDKWFQFYKLDNVVLNINEDATPILNESQEYNFTMMGVSIDNWVNLVIQKTFIAE